MKLFILLLFSFLTSISYYGQNRKTLLKEVNSYKYQTCKNEQYQTSAKELILLSYKYFRSKKYKPHSQNDSSVVFSKTINIPNTTGLRNLVRHYIYIDITIKEDLKTIYIDDRTLPYKAPFAGKSEPSPTIRGAFKLDRKAYYKYIYNNLCNADVEISEELKTKVNNYNIKQTKEKKQLIAGRDY